MTMSMLVSVSDGIVLASDSRTSYASQGGAIRILTDSANKMW